MRISGLSDGVFVKYMRNNNNIMLYGSNRGKKNVLLM